MKTLPTNELIEQLADTTSAIFNLDATKSEIT